MGEVVSTLTLTSIERMISNKNSAPNGAICWAKDAWCSPSRLHLGGQGLMLRPVVGATPCPPRKLPPGAGYRSDEWPVLKI